jgi:hypothetical protein
MELPTGTVQWNVVPERYYIMLSQLLLVGPVGGRAKPAVVASDHG